MNKTTLLTLGLLLGSTFAANQLGDCPTADSYTGVDLWKTFTSKTLTAKYIDKGLVKLAKYAEKAAAMKGIDVSINPNLAACYSFAASSSTAGTIDIAVPDYDSLSLAFSVDSVDTSNVIASFSDYEYPVTVADWDSSLGALLYVCADSTTA